MKRVVSVLAVAMSLSASCVFATPTVISPDESTSKDTFTYGAIPSGVPFGNASFLGASLESSGIHTVHSLIQFDLSTASLNVNEAASVRVYARSKAGTPFSSVASDPSATSPVVVDVYKVTSAWDEATTTFSTEPSIDPVAVASFTVTGLDTYYSADITSLVSGWLSSPSTNFGVELRQRAVVPVTGAPDAAAVFQSSGAANRPELLIVSVPEPTTLATLSIVSMLGARRRR